MFTSSIPPKLLLLKNPQKPEAGRTRTCSGDSTLGERLWEGGGAQAASWRAGYISCPGVLLLLDQIDFMRKCISNCYLKKDVKSPITNKFKTIL